ncbi:MAG TPA: hypothetical protein VFM28_03930 [Nitrososphaeraceae archaeon]|nr:hypothetical protein [Nitrososphaeraceae archaeon]
MKIPNLYVYSILAIGMIFSIPTLLDNVQAQTNATNATSSLMQNQTAQAAAAGQNQTMSQDAQALMALDIPEVRDNLIAAKESLANGEIADALTGVTDLENQLILLQNKTTFTEDIQKIKNAISKSDLNKALDEITNIQTGILKAETEISKAQLANPELMAAQQDEDEEE